MSFQYSTNPTEWQDSYTERHAFADSLQRGGSLLIPSAFILTIPTIFGVFCLLSWLTQAQAENISRSSQIFVMAAGFIIVFVPIIFFVLSLIHLYKNAETFLKTFYDLPDSINDANMVGLRVFGCPPTPPPLSALFKFPVIKAAKGKLDPPESWHAKIGGPAKLKVEAGNALYLERGNHFSRVVGQGSAFLEIHETIKTVLNTCPQSEEISVTAWTRDGIRMILKAKGEYILGSTGGSEGKESELYSYDPASARKAVEDTFASGKEGNEWSKSAMGKTIGFLGEYISGKYLDDIFISSKNGQLLTTSTMEHLLSEVNARLDKSGIRLFRLQILDAELPKEITQQRIKLWETGHKTYATISESEVRAYQLGEQKKALAKMVHDFVFTLANGLERLEKNNITEKLLSSIYEVINEGMKDPLSYLKSISKIMPDGVEPPDLDFNFGEDKK